eukprot:CAMPEP_0196761542 /NCGR_PEP_ID=MMETSP1095-20130614/809_1 /TAXON_ID=96789 ORGANISM="Chromulina nebulosa, Strain UTEXLB2642" /NCGR_SAMPLE_ID=MMETSP1095 /ASSEMBLY_ACC=CAM_ASM_000446 /LENGTH=482 /DNA_ID=CAMNT_0042111219 /DNA_START=217 /DNA_END=1662 /DNA_ORIENTATION=-
MPTFIFLKNRQVIDQLKGADPHGLEAKVNQHKVDVDPFSASKGFTIGKQSAEDYPTNSRDARLKAFSHIDSKKPTNHSKDIKTSHHPTKVPVDLSNDELVEEDEEALAKAIALSIVENKPDNTTKSAIDSNENEVEDDFVPVPVNAEILNQIIDMGFSDVRARKGIVHGHTLEGALQWLDEHENDPEIDQPYLVKRADAERCDENGNRKPLSDEERAQKVKELTDKAKLLREQKARKEKEDAILKEKERRERGKKIETVAEDRERLIRQLELAKAKKEKEDIKLERERLRAEIARDKEMRKKNAGVLPSVLGVDGYNPSAIQFDVPMTNNTSASSTSDKRVNETITSTKPVSVSEPVSKKPTLKPSVANKPVADDSDPDTKVDKAIQLIMKYRTGGDGGQALKLLIVFLKNIVENPNDQKYRSINTDSNAYKSKLQPIVGPYNILIAVGFEKSEDGKLKYNKPEVDQLVKNTLTKLIQAEQL